MMFAGTNAAEYVVSGSSTANAVQILLLRFFVTRNALCRVQVKPTTYWPSTVLGLSTTSAAIKFQDLVDALPIAKAFTLIVPDDRLKLVPHRLEERLPAGSYVRLARAGREPDANREAC